MRRSDFRDLQVWVKGRAICIDLYKVTANFPVQEQYGIVSQIRRAAVSVPTNIAEGHGRSSDADFVRFLHISLGSVKELETLLDISVELGYFKDRLELLPRLGEESKMIASLILTLTKDAKG
ncbi:MAG: four helix bundle protein [Armatimonadetes bacterium]|nr:four helix bundle protein [Armatimonadota bacterium]